MTRHKRTARSAAFAQSRRNANRRALAPVPMPARISARGPLRALAERNLTGKRERLERKRPAPAPAAPVPNVRRTVSIYEAATGTRV